MTARVTQEEFRRLKKSDKRSKYGNRRTAGYDSKKEARRGVELEQLEQAGEIVNLRRQVAIYRADFVYERDGRRIVEDVKGYRTET